MRAPSQVQNGLRNVVFPSLHSICDDYVADKALPLFETISQQIFLKLYGSCILPSPFAKEQSRKCHAPRNECILNMCTDWPLYEGKFRFLLGSDEFNPWSTSGTSNESKYYPYFCAMRMTFLIIMICIVPFRAEEMQEPRQYFQNSGAWVLKLAIRLTPY
jgi:hypothetical protein